MCALRGKHQEFGCFLSGSCVSLWASRTLRKGARASEHLGEPGRTSERLGAPRSTELAPRSRQGSPGSAVPPIAVVPKPLAPQEHSINTVTRRAVRTTLVAAAGTAVLAAGLTACGTARQLSAAEKVSDAFGRLGDGTSFSAKLSVDASPAQIIAFGSATGDEIDARSAAALSSVGVSLSFSADKPLKDLQSFTSLDGALSNDALKADTSLSFDYAVTGKGGKALAEMRHVGGTVYLRADAAGLAATVGEDPSVVDEMTTGFPAVLKGALAGKWVSLDPGTLEGFAESAGAGRPGGPSGTLPSAAPSLSAGTADGLALSLKDILTHDFTFEDRGTKDGTQHIAVSAPARRLAQDALKAVEPLTEQIPNLGKLPTAVPNDLPDRRLTLDVYLDHGALSSVTFDVAQLDDKLAPGVSFPVKIAFGKDVPAIQAPAGATAITGSDLDDVTAAFRAAGAGGEQDSSSDGGPAGRFGNAEPLTDAQIKELAQGGGLTEQEIRTYSQFGFGYDEIKSIATSSA
ncbi:hypothetical protein [Kitasatospora sp. NBC_00315]|uniref:hypothetical protein n=1 Tax=Kitasatospora sp. NBC_00315 TaxID=2975963 RepID=UPI003243F331